MRRVLVWLAYPLLGALSGLLAGMLGVGGGLVVVPGLLFVFAASGLPPEHSMRLALGTSLAAICFTSASSLRAHHRHGAVDWRIVGGITPGIVVGAYSGAWLATFLEAATLRLGYAAFLVVVCVRMLRAPPPLASGRLPGRAGLGVAGIGIGSLSGLVGIGGGSLSVPYLVRSGVTMHRAVGTSAAIGAPIAIVGALGYIANGLGVPGLPPFALGYVYLPALLGVAAISIGFAPLGAALAHRLPVARLRAAFAAFLLLIAARMVFEQIRDLAVR